MKILWKYKIYRRVSRDAVWDCWGGQPPLPTGCTAPPKGTAAPNLETVTCTFIHDTCDRNVFYLGEI